MTTTPPRTKTDHHLATAWRDGLTQLVLCAAAASLGAPAAAQDLRAQCTPQNATEVLRAIYPSEIAQYPALAAILADPAGGPVRAAVNDCLYGREGGGRAGMQRWISIPQNRQWYWDNLVGPPLAQELRAQCTAPNASQVLRTVFAAEIRNQPDLDRFFGMADATPVRAAVNDCQHGREGGGRAGMERWIAQPQNRQWYWQNLIATPFAQWQAAQPRAGAPGGTPTVVVAQPGPGTGRPPAAPGAPAPVSGPMPAQPAPPAQPEAPGSGVKVPFPSLPQRAVNMASQARPAGQAGREILRSPVIRELPELGEAAAFLAMVGPLAELLANPNRLAGLGGPDGAAPAAPDAHRLALAQALSVKLLEQLELGGLRCLDDAVHEAAWRTDPASVQPLASWRERSLASISDHRVDLPQVRDLGVRLDWTRYDSAQTLFMAIELSRFLKTSQRRIDEYNELISDALDRFAPLEDMPLPQLQAALKTVALTVVVAELTSLVIEGSAAWMPGRIDDFYVQIEGQNRRQGDPPLQIEKDDKPKRLKVFITYSTHGGKLSTPWNAVELFVPRLLKHPKVARAVEAASKRAGAAAANLERQIEARIKADAHGALRAELERLYRDNEDLAKAFGSKFYDYLKSSVPEIQIRATKRTTDINSDQVLFMESNSKNLLKVDCNGCVPTQAGGTPSRAEKEFYLLALADSGGKEAGYHVSLKQPLLERLVRLDDRSSASPNLRGTVIIIDPRKPPARHPAAGSPCANGAGLIDIWGRCNLPY